MKTLFAFLTVMGMLLSASVIIAEDCDCGAGEACAHRCPACPKCSNKICTSSVERTKEKHQCFNVECKEICVPAITLPCWTDVIPFFKSKAQSCNSSCGCGNNCPTKECCPAPRCGYVKVVKVLKKHEYECDSCGYKWNIEAPCCESGACGTGNCSTGAPSATGSSYAPTTTEENNKLPPVPPQANRLPAPGGYYGTDLRFQQGSTPALQNQSK